MATPTLTYQVGAVRMHLISDGVFWTDGGGVFGVVPRVMWEQVIRPDELNRIPMDLRCLLIESSAGLILVDTGYGVKLSAKQMAQLNLTSPNRLLDGLAALGYRPEDVRMVINTHLHADHCGGNTCFDRRPPERQSKDTADLPKCNLPDAAVGTGRRDLSQRAHANTYFAENFLPLADLRNDEGASRLRVLHGDTQITPEVRVQVTPGHTRAHQVVIIESQGETAIFLADAGYAANLERLAWVPAFDVEPLVSIETKRSLAIGRSVATRCFSSSMTSSPPAGLLLPMATAGGWNRWTADGKQGVGSPQRYPSSMAHFNASTDLTIDAVCRAVLELFSVIGSK